MGAVLDGLGDTKTMLAHNTVLWAGGGILTLVIGVVIFAVNLIPILGSLVTLFLAPVLATGLIGLAYAARNGNASIDDFTNSVSENYVTYLAGSVLYGLAVGGMVIGFFIVTIFMAFVGSSSGTASGGSEAMFASMGLVSMLVFVLMVGIMFLLGLAFQFFDVAIVVDDQGPVDAFKRSLSLFKSAPGSVVGYTLMRSLLGVIVMGVPVAGVLLLTIGSTYVGDVGGIEAAGPIVLVGFAIWGLVVLPIGNVILITYHVAFYNRHRAAGTI